MQDSLPNTGGVADTMRSLLDAQRRAFVGDMNPPRAVRDERLARLAAMVAANEARIVEAIQADFGNRSRHQTLLAEIVMVQGTIAHARKHLARWMKPTRPKTSVKFLPGRNRLMRQPLGVVGIVSPWNYPCNLALCPAAEALAAGNRVMIKPSESTPRFSQLLAEIVGKAFKPDEMTVVVGDAAVGAAFVALPFDHLLFTGSTAVGRLVAEAAAKNLTPVTLELGGKSPVIVDPSADLADVAAKVVNAKCFNAGQTCIAPDYLLVQSGQVEPLVNALRQAFMRLYPKGIASPDYTSIIDARHFRRLLGLIDEARSKGARVVVLGDETASADPSARRLSPTLLVDVNPTMKVMEEEIFGPVLPIVTVRNTDEAIGYVNAHDRPLSLYWFGEDAAARDKVLAGTISGGVTVNDCIWHFAQENQPFGGVGASGNGAYHGEAGFLTFSKEKPVFYQSRFSSGWLFDPPYGKRFDRLLAIVRRLG